jgi:methylenetetrahydrofolate dehydrogenase (NADP+)/methenyltetrahydrofolate cyclohydrolase
MRLLEGQKIADKILTKVAKDLKRAENKAFLAVILIGDNEASKIYTNLKGKAARRIGMGFKLFRFQETASEKEIVEKINELNDNKKMSGIIVQLPLPGKFNTQRIINSINPKKDVDGFKKNSELVPVFPKAIMAIIDSSKKDIKNKKAIVLANSKIFGEMMANSLKGKKVEAEYVLRKDIRKSIDRIRAADILVSALGKKGIVKGEMIKSGAIVIDGGITKEKRRVFGDIDFESAKKRAGFITPVPGGVGPVTIACLLENVYLASKML